MISLPLPISQGMPYKFSSSSCFPGPDGESGSAVPQGLGSLHHQLYTQALLAYTFSLAGEMDVRNTLLEKLDQQAISSGTLAMLGDF